jgi:hypothetical protein
MHSAHQRTRILDPVRFSPTATVVAGSFNEPKMSNESTAWNLNAAAEIRWHFLFALAPCETIEFSGYNVYTLVIISKNIYYPHPDALETSGDYYKSYRLSYWLLNDFHCANAILVQFNFSYSFIFPSFHFSSFCFKQSALLPFDSKFIVLAKLTAWKKFHSESSSCTNLSVCH